MVAIPFQGPCHPFSESLLLMATLIYWLYIGKYSMSWRMLAHGYLLVSGGKDKDVPQLLHSLFTKESIFFFSRALRGDCSLVLLWCLGFLGVLQLVPALNYLAQLLLARILAASSAWLILIQLVCWQTEFCAILKAVSALWTSSNYINDKCTSKAFASC